MAQDTEQPKKEKFDAKSFIFGHTGDSYCFHITEINEHPVCVWLPVMVKCKDGGSWHCFSSKHICELKDGETFEHNGANFRIEPIKAPKYPGKLVEVKPDGSLSRPFDISFTKTPSASSWSASSYWPSSCLQRGCTKRTRWASPLNTKAWWNG